MTRPGKRSRLLRDTPQGEEVKCYMCEQWRPIRWFWYGETCIPCHLKQPQRSARWWADFARIARERNIPVEPAERPPHPPKPRKPKPLDWLDLVRKPGGKPSNLKR